MSTKHQQRKAPAQQPKRTPEVTALVNCAHAQDKLSRARETARIAADTRRDAIRAAFRAGVSAQDIADAVQISRAKIYQLIGGTKRPTA